MFLSSIACLLLLSVLQAAPALVCIVGISFVTAVVGPLLLNRMQEAVSDDVRATMPSLQSLLFSLTLAVAQPSLGLVADRAGLPAAYLALAGALALAMAVLLWFRRSGVQWVEAQPALSRSVTE